MSQRIWTGQDMAWKFGIDNRPFPSMPSVQSLSQAMCLMALCGWVVALAAHVVLRVLNK